LQQQAYEKFDNNPYFLRADLGNSAGSARAFPEAFPPGDADLGWYAVVTLRWNGCKIALICWIEIIEGREWRDHWVGLGGPGDPGAV